MADQRPDTIRLQRIAKAFWESAALMSAVEIGIFTAIARGHSTVAAVAAETQIEPQNAERLLTALTAMELVSLDEDTFTNAPDVQRFLVEDSASYAGPWMLFTKPRWEAWGKLTERLRQPSDQQRVLGMYDANFTVETARTYHEATYSIGMGAARRFHRQVDLSGRRKLIDLGGGSGCYCIVGATLHPQLNAVVLDLPPVVEVTRQFLVENGVADRVQAQPCDFTKDALPSGADVAIMASNLPQYSREIIAGVVSRVYDALEPGGEFHLIGETLDDDRTGPLAPALWGLSEAVNESTGLAHTVGDCIGYLADAGFENVSNSDFIPGSLSRICGYKRP